ncbi:twin-arginine translocation signal domain-containing protein [Streptomyces sp. NRRL S-646]|nr:twin-arginine translocation signal domain-containing protein [Streptomyces sp. NRRL S-646]
MASHTRRGLLKGAAVAAAGSVVGSGLGPGS